MDRWTDSHTVADGENVRERTAFLSILVDCLQMISKNRTAYVYESPHHSTLQRKRTNDGEKDSWRKKLEFDAVILLVRGAAGILVMFTRTPPF